MPFERSMNVTAYELKCPLSIELSLKISYTAKLKFCKYSVSCIKSGGACGKKCEALDRPETFTRYVCHHQVSSA